MNAEEKDSLIHVCTNTETLVDSFDKSNWSDEDETAVADAWYNAAMRCIEAANLADGGTEFEQEANFHDWHGGRFVDARLHYSIGGVAVDADAPAWAKELADRAADAGRKAADAEAERIDRDNAEFATEEE